MQLEQLRELATSLVADMDNERRLEILYNVCGTLFPEKEDIKFLIPELRGLANALELVTSEDPADQFVAQVLEEIGKSLQGGKE